jgi:glycosyltransferase involved in cell wall biosynthesis
MRILLVSSGSGSRGGGEIFLDYLGRGLTERGHELLMWMPVHPRMDELAARVAPFARVIRAEYRNTYDHPARSLATCFNWGTSRDAARAWEELKPDVIHLNKQNLEDGLDLLRALRRSKVPSVCTIHLTQSARYLRAKAATLRDWIAANAMRKYRGVFVAVQEVRRQALDEFVGGRVRTRTIFNGVPLLEHAAPRDVRDATRRKLGLNDDAFLVVGVGRLVEQKRPFVFLKTAQELYRHLPTARFVWIGDGELSGRWKDWIDREGLGGVISCVGWQADTQPFLLAADLLLHVAEYEGLPLAVIEAMAAGVPCAVTRNFASEVPLFDEATVVFLDDTSRLAARLRDTGGLREVAARARQLVEDQLSLRRMLDAYEHLYLEATAK